MDWRGYPLLDTVCDIDTFMTLKKVKYGIFQVKFGRILR